MADRKSNNKNNKKKRYNGKEEEDFNPKFRKMRKKYARCVLIKN